MQIQLEESIFLNDNEIVHIFLFNLVASLIAIYSILNISLSVHNNQSLAPRDCLTYLTVKNATKMVEMYSRIINSELFQTR